MLERRQLPRTEEDGEALASLNSWSAPCTVENMSPTGARLRFRTAAILPLKFNLRILAQGRDEFAQVIWRHGAVAGVSFVSPAMSDALRERSSASAYI